MIAYNGSVGGDRVVRFRIQEEIELPCCINLEYEVVNTSHNTYLVRCKKCGRLFIASTELKNDKVYFELYEVKEE